MKTYKKILIVSIILALMLSGCGSDVTSSLAGKNESEVISDTFGAELSTDSVVSDDNADSAEYEQSMPDDNEISASDGETTSTTETLSPSNEASAPALDAYPSTDEILSCVDAGESKLYWVAEAPSYSGDMDIQAVEKPDEDDFAAELSNILGGGYTVSKNVESSGVINVVSDGAELDVAAVLTALTQLTGTEYAEIEPEEVYVAQYVPVWNGYNVDAEGFFYGGERAGEGVMGSHVDIIDNEIIVICNPLVISGTAESIDTAELIAPDTMETICRGYYESQIGPYVTIVKDITLGYYYSESEGKLLPAWQGEITFYRSEIGHSDSILMDAQTGELLRK